MGLAVGMGWAAAIAAACMVQACAKPGEHLIQTDAISSVFLRKAGGWVLSPARPSYPYNSEPGLQAVYGAGGDAPFGCGFTGVRYGYFSGLRGGLACTTRPTDGRFQMKDVQKGASFTRIYDAAPLQNGFIVVVKPFGSTSARAIFLGSDGEAQGASTLPGRAPDEAIILSTGRIALLRDDGASCNWTILELGEGEFAPVATTPADRPLCHLSSFGGELLRDQTSGQTYLRSGYPERNALYRIDDNGPRNPAALIAADFAADIDPVSSAAVDHVTAYDGAVYFRYPTQAGPIVGRYDLETELTTRTDFRSSSGNWRDAERVYGFAIAKILGASPHVAVMSSSGDTRVTTLAP